MATETPQGHPRLLIVDDDVDFCRILARAMEGRGFAVSVAHDVAAGSVLAAQLAPAYAVIDLRMPGPSGLELVKRLHERDAAARIVVLTGYASIATAIEAIKAGATHYLSKPCKAAEILAAFRRDTADTAVSVPADPLSVDRLEWEHIQRVLQEHDGNISATATALDMHRRTLQRKLSRGPPSE